MDLPPRLSDRQMFVLAWLAREGKSVRIGSLSRAVAKEFGGIIDRKERAESIVMETDDVEAGLHASSLLETILSGLDQKVLSPEHRASFSRTLERLEERGLVNRYRSSNLYVGGARGGEEAHRTIRAGLTNQGSEVGEEVLRRIEDGRYSLGFATLE